MSRNILIFSDGTGQAGGLTPDQRISNVYKLYRAARVGPDSSINPAEQLAYYDAGLGSRPPGGGLFKTVVRKQRSIIKIPCEFGPGGRGSQFLYPSISRAIISHATD